MSEEEMELLKDVCTWKAEEYRWINDDKFCVWVHYFNIEEFMEELRTICDFDPYNDVLDAQIQDYCVCIELTARLFDKDELESAHLIDRGYVNDVKEEKIRRWYERIKEREYERKNGRNL